MDTLWPYGYPMVVGIRLGSNSKTTLLWHNSPWCFLKSLNNHITIFNGPLNNHHFDGLTHTVVFSWLSPGHTVGASIPCPPRCLHLLVTRGTQQGLLVVAARHICCCNACGLRGAFLSGWVTVAGCFLNEVLDIVCLMCSNMIKLFVGSSPLLTVRWF